jgi:rod shape-determining protein MreD
MLNENLKIMFQFTLLILIQIILLDNINLFGFLNPIIYILFIITYKFDQNQTLFIFLCFLLGFITDLLTQSSGANTISCLILGYIRPFIINSCFKINSNMPKAYINDPNISHRFYYILSIVLIHHLIYFSIVYFDINSLILIIKYTVLSTIFSFILLWTLISFYRS